MKKWMKTVSLILFVFVAGILHSCTMEQEDGILVQDVTGEGEIRETDVEDETQKDKMLCIYLIGCVSRPGVYEVAEGTRIHELIALAGGFTEEADETFLNLAAFVSDGQKIVVYSREETVTGIPSEGKETSSLVNINQADKDTLMSLPGIGESKADAIIQYREEQGFFSDIEEIMNISGIKEGAFEKIKELITI